MSEIACISHPAGRPAAAGRCLAHVPCRGEKFKLAMNASVTFSLTPIPPFRLDFTTWALRRRPNNLIDRRDGETYRRGLAINGYPAEVAVKQSGPPDLSRLRVKLTGRRVASQMKATVSAALEHLLGLRINLSEFYRLAETDPRLGVLAQRFRGLKPSRFPTIFEALANAIGCQQMSLSLGILLLSRITGSFGLAVEGTGGAVQAFPRPEDLADLQPTTLRKLGFSYQKGRSLIDLARAAGPIYYLAGPPAMVAAMRRTLIEAGLDEDDIRTEEFSGY
jgi:DNA-3-methyladenine glycosylase II